MNLSESWRVSFRFLGAASIAVLAWAVVAAGWLDRTVVPRLDQGLRDFYLSLTVDSRSDIAPGLLHLTFDNEALSATRLPTRVPLPAVRDMLEAARYTRQTVILDIDLATRSDVGNLDQFTQYLRGWSADAGAPLLVLAYPLYEVPYRDMEAFRRLDAIIGDSANIRWAGVGTFADADGIVRSYEYWSCVDRLGEGARSALPSVALYAWARHEVPDTRGALAAVDAAMRAANGRCAEGAEQAPIRVFSQSLPQSGVIEYQTSVDALADDSGDSRYAPDGLPRLISVGYCRIAPAACGASGGKTELGAVATGRIVLVSAANDFSRDDHATPVGYLSGSVILGNAARALINTGPPQRLPAGLQLALVLAAVVLIQLVWAAAERLRSRLRAGENWPSVRKALHGTMNPAVVQWLAFGVADLAILIYYYFAFRSSDWNGLVGASFGATTVAAISAFRDWWSTPWDEERRGEGE